MFKLQARLEKLWELEKTVLIEFQASNLPIFKAEFYKLKNKRLYKILVNMQESFKVIPSFDGNSQDYYDHEMMVSDPTFDNTELEVESVNQALAWLMNEFEKRGLKARRL